MARPKETMLLQTQCRVARDSRTVDGVPKVEPWLWGDARAQEADKAKQRPRSDPAKNGILEVGLRFIAWALKGHGVCIGGVQRDHDLQGVEVDLEVDLSARHPVCEGVQQRVRLAP